MKALQFSRSGTDKTILEAVFLIENRRLTITTTINDKLAAIKIVKNWKVCLTRSAVWLAGAILQMFWSVKQHNKNVKCVETTLTKLCNQSNHSMKSPVIKLPICHSHWSPGHPSTSGINLIKILVASPVSDSITGVSFNMSDLWCHWWGSRSSTQTRVDIITRCVTTQHQYICLARRTRQPDYFIIESFVPFWKKLFSFVQVQWHNNYQPPF